MTATPHEQAARRAVEAVWRIESGRLIAGLARITRDLGLAEELAQDALVTALEQWPRTGTPPNPAGWLMTTAKHRAIDLHRRSQIQQRKLDVLGRDLTEDHDPISAEMDDALDDHIGDDLLRLVFTACHPALSMDARVALTLRCLGGLSTDEIARAFLIPEPTAAQRIVRAKRTLATKGVAFELPGPQELAHRLASVLEVVYLVFNEGCAATAGDDWMRPGLCEEALRLGRVLAGLVPDEPEVHGLVALMEIQASRSPARTGPDGEPVLLADQDRRRWDRLLIRRGLQSLTRAQSLPAPIGPYTMQAAIAACHARTATVEDTDWARIAELYRVLAHLWPSPVVELNRAVAVGMSAGPAQGLAIVEQLAADGELSDYPQLAAVRGDLLDRLGRTEQARAAFEQAALLTRNEREREIFLRRAGAVQTRVRERLKAALPAALKTRDAVAVAALRSALAAIDNAEAADLDQAPAAGPGHEHLAGTVAGLRAAEVERRTRTEVQMRAIVTAEITDRRTAAIEYERRGHPDQAERLRAEATVLTGHLGSAT
jgi:RNA polymerase sigma factor (sigma-70 family)